MAIWVSDVLMSPTSVEHCSLKSSDLLCDSAMSSFTFVISLYTMSRHSERDFFFSSGFAFVYFHSQMWPLWDLIREVYLVVLF